MHICFIDNSSCNYNVNTPFEAPLGGTQSAAAYLAIELAQLGHHVSLISNHPTSGAVRGVSCVSLKEVTPRILRQLASDVLLCLLSPGNAALYRSLLPTTRLIFWTGHAADQPDVQPLRDAGCRAALDACAFVSTFQQNQFVQMFNLDPARTRVLRNAVAPAFLDLFKPGESILSAKSLPPVLAYTPTPFRGLDLLLQFFPEIRRRVPGTRLQVFSSMKVYQSNPATEQARFGQLYDLCRRTEGVEYIGSLPQPELASRLKFVSLFAYPNTFVETSCIALMEAMAAGCNFVTSDLGGLPETAANFGQLHPILNTPPAQYRARFIDAVVSQLERQLAPENAALETRLADQVAFSNREYRWDRRAQEWSDWLQQLPPR